MLYEAKERANPLQSLTVQQQNKQTNSKLN